MGDTGRSRAPRSGVPVLRPASAGQESIGGGHERTDSQLRQAREGDLDLMFSAGMQDIEIQSERAGENCCPG